jgi:hypothetical protein
MVLGFGCALWEIDVQRPVIYVRLSRYGQQRHVHGGRTRHSSQRWYRVHDTWYTARSTGAE